MLPGANDGSYNIDFGFKVNDPFFSLTIFGGTRFFAGDTSTSAEGNLTNNQLSVNIYTV
jgi:hypothetical protein